MESSTVTQVSSVSGTLKRSIMITVPSSISTPEKSDDSEELIVFETFSASLVMRLITSPCEWLSSQGMGSEMTFSNSSLRSRKITRWLSLAEKKPCSRVAAPWIR